MNELQVFINGVHDGARIDDDRYGSLWELVAPAGGVVQKFGFAWVEVKPGAESPLHFHRQTEELYHIVRGAGEMTVGDKTVHVGPGSTVSIPTQTPHKIRAGDAGIAFVCVTCPPYDWYDDIEL